MSSVKQEIARPVTPLGILVEHLETAVAIAKKQPNLSAELTANLDQAWRLAAGLDSYVDECTSDESPALAEIALEAFHRTQQEYLKKTSSVPLQGNENGKQHQFKTTIGTS